MTEKQFQEYNGGYILIIGLIAVLIWAVGWYIFFNAYELFTGSDIVWLDILFGNFGVIVGLGLMVFGSMFLWEKLQEKIRWE